MTGWLLEIPGLHVTRGQNERELLLGARGLGMKAVFARAAARKRKERERIELAWLAAGMHRHEIGKKLPLAIVMTRVAPRRIDDDNVGGGFKAIRDELARLIGVNDGSPLVSWTCRQKSGRFGVEVEVIPFACIENRVVSARLASDGQI